MLPHRLTVRTFVNIERNLTLDDVSDVTLMTLHLWTMSADGTPEYVSCTAYKRDTLGDLVATRRFSYDSEGRVESTTHAAFNTQTSRESLK
jgi:hypothetical protein